MNTESIIRAIFKNKISNVHLFVLGLNIYTRSQNWSDTKINQKNDWVQGGRYEEFKVGQLPIKDKAGEKRTILSIV